METVNLSMKGQVTIPVKVRNALKMEPLQELELTYDLIGKRVILQKPTEFADVVKLLRALPIAKQVKPLTDVHEYYEAARSAEMRGDCHVKK